MILTFYFIYWLYTSSNESLWQCAGKSYGFALLLVVLCCPSCLGLIV